MIRLLLCIFISTSSIFSSQVQKPARRRLSNESNAMLRNTLMRNKVEEANKTLIKALNRDNLKGIAAALNNGADPNQMIALNNNNKQVKLPLLSYAVYHRLTSLVALVLSKKPDLSKTSSEGLTALHYAAQDTTKLAARLAKSLLHAGADKDQTDRDGKTAFYHAADYNNKDVAQALADVKADPNYTDTRYPRLALKVACFKGHDAMVKLLLKAGAEIDACNLAGITPLMSAAMAGNLSTVELLLQQQANPSLRNPTNGWTAQDYVFCAPDKTREQKHTQRDLENLLSLHGSQ